jgi:hypothetical protein
MAEKKGKGNDSSTFAVPTLERKERVQDGAPTFASYGKKSKGNDSLRVPTSHEMAPRELRGNRRG